MLDSEEPRAMRELKVDPAELETAFDYAAWERAYYLDVETCEVIMISDEIRGELERLYEELGGESEIQPDALAEALQQRDLPEWRRRALQEADQVKAGYGTRYLRVPTADSHEGYGDMEDFIATVRDERLQDGLWRAIRGRGAFRYFKDVLSDYPHERERWFKFKDAQVRQRVLDWLESEGIKPIMD